MENIAIEPAEIKDLQQLQETGRRTFYETFRDSNSEKNMQSYLNDSFNLQKLTSELENPESFFFLAKLDNKTAGYLKINVGSAQTENPDGNSLEIERIYVLAEFQRMKVGQLLFEKALEVARSRNADFIWLGVWEENKKAISFYERNGFVTFGKHDFVLGEDVQTDILMKCVIKKNTGF